MLSLFENDNPALNTEEPKTMTALSQLLDTYRNAAASEREKGTYFEELMLAYSR